MRLRHLMIAASTAALLAACAPKTPAPAPEAAAPEAEVETVEAEAPLHVDVIDCGTIKVSDLDIFSSAGDYAGVSDTLTDSCFLVKHPNGILLWDLGLPGMLVGNGENTQGVFTVSLDTSLTEKLADLGVVPSEINYVAISHSHFDHTGQIDQVQGSTWLVNQKEKDAMFPPDGSAPYDPSLAPTFAMFSPMEQQVIGDEYDVFGDGSVVIFQTPGHTPGHSSLQLMMPESGPVLLTGDLYHRKESRELKRVPRFNFDEAETLASMDAFEARAERLGAKVIIQHEPDDIEALNGEIR
ncbi:MAG: N-acyl homoserine lactonase family protein [Alphaproteobacteria bacterium]|nr:N-acyl homoserine lactonase family protein [Alphaproteobacteria bacterium]MBU2144148.1 N-acyl homoserine lactonase family protein [Alphaproteobacteria bacterium]MBU2198263.1 N-acyl homoserine lactonase family protein [Alphaproteobacteria bacterium]